MTGKGGFGPGLAVALVVALGLVAPILAGLWQTARAAFGHLPAIGATGIGLAPFVQLSDQPGLARAIAMSLITGMASTLVSLALALALGWALQGRPGAARWLAPYLAVPHAAMAIGLAFLLAPSGWIARVVAPVPGWDRPPDLALVNDPWGIALVIGLVVKEMPFLLIVLLAALGQVPAARLMAAGRALGYGPGMVWIKIILPQVWPLIRLPVAVVLAYGLSVVDMALILGPSNPPVLSVLLLRLFVSPDLALLLPASAGALVQLALVILALALMALAERALAWLGRRWLRRGARGRGAAAGLRAGALLAQGLLALGGLSLLSLLVWSVAWRWPWPALWPESLSGRAWGAGDWAAPLGQTLVIAASSTGLSLALAIAWLESADRRQGTGQATDSGRHRPALLLICLPLLVPQVSFLFGVNMLAVQAGLSGGLTAVIWGQVLFVFPYVMIALSGPWQALDPRLARAAAALGAGPCRRLWAVKLPLLLGPLCLAAAIGVAVSVAQYLPTLFLGAGRIRTLTTEAVTLASSSDRRVTGVLASLQAALPALAYLAAQIIPALVYRNRAALKGPARHDPGS